ncbi:toxin [Rhodobacteraceae bacterium CCMM004]|nr:toxin [Rhodobacteraceae bacterium CCMM004]
MKLRWDPAKEQKLHALDDRCGVTFADCVVAIEEGRVLDDVPHPTRDHERLLVLAIEGYAYVVPYVPEADGSLFLKTVFPSRKHTVLGFGKPPQ